LITSQSPQRSSISDTASARLGVRQQSANRAPVAVSVENSDNHHSQGRQYRPAWPACGASSQLLFLEFHMATVTANRIVLQDNQGHDRVVLEIDAQNQVQITVIAKNGRKAVNIHESFDGDGVLYLNGDNCAIEMNAEGQSPSLGIITGSTIPVSLDKNGLHTH
jgi:hypothetical protein